MPPEKSFEKKHPVWKYVNESEFTPFGMKSIESLYDDIAFMKRAIGDERFKRIMTGVDSYSDDINDIIYAVYEEEAKS